MYIGKKSRCHYRIISTAVRWWHPMVSLPHWSAKTLLSCPLGGVLTPGPSTQVSLCSLLFCWEDTSQSCVWDASSSERFFLAGFPVPQTHLTVQFVIPWVWGLVSCLWCHLLCEMLSVEHRNTFHSSVRQHLTVTEHFIDKLNLILLFILLHIAYLDYFSFFSLPRFKVALM